MRNLRNKKKKLIKNRLTNIEDSLVISRAEGVQGLEEGGKVLKKYKLVVDRWSWGWEVLHRECSHQ